MHLSATQLIASALAAVTATLVGSYLGVSGTIVGAAVASVITVSGNAVYGHSLRRTRDRVRDAVPAFARYGSPTASDGSPSLASIERAATGSTLIDVLPPAGGPVRRTFPLRKFVLTVVAMFVLIIAAVTSVEVVAGQPISDLLRGKSGHGTTLLGTTGGSSSPQTPAPAATVTATVTAPPTNSPTTIPTQSSSASTSPSTTPTPSSSTTPSESASTTSTATPAG